MAKVLISCVGTGRKDTKEVSKREYEKATYVLEGKDYETAFVSFALYQHYDIDKIILVGTANNAKVHFFKGNSTAIVHSTLKYNAL